MGSDQHIFISDLKPGPLDGTYRVLNPRLLKTSRGDDYLALGLSDRSGEVNAKIWQVPANILEEISAGTFLSLHGRVEIFRERPQCIIERFEVVDLQTLDASIFQKTAPIQPEKVYAEVVQLLHSLEDPWLLKLAQAYLNDIFYNEAFKVWPAAMRMHHPYLHGLLEHVHSVMQLGQVMSDHYPWVDRDLVLLGLFLHDSGKIIELMSTPEEGYSVHGQLLGHITIGICMLHEKAGLIENFPEDRLVQLKHIILSHHENPEYGSPKPPMFPEAQLIHTIEMLDAKMNAFLREQELPAEQKDEIGGIRYSRLLRRGLYTPKSSE